jgi:hypothetical protein
MFTDLPPQLLQYAERINARLKAAFRPSTLQAHRHAVMALALFCLYNDLSFPGINIYTLLSFMEFLLDSGLSIPTVKNYISSVKSSFKVSNVSIQVFESPRLSFVAGGFRKTGFVFTTVLNAYFSVLDSPFTSFI